MSHAASPCGTQGPVSRTKRLRTEEGSSLPFRQSWDSNPCQSLHSSPLGRVLYFTGMFFETLTSLLTLVLQAMKRPVKEAMWSLLLFCKKKQAWAGAFRVYTGHDKCWTTGGDRETCLCLCSKAWASWMLIWLSEEGSWCHLSLQGREGIQADTTVYTKAVTAAMKWKDACSLEEKLWPT